MGFIISPLGIAPEGILFGHILEKGDRIVRRQVTKSTRYLAPAAFFCLIS